jgi:DNA mismatch endonuclease (patch repair protein)
MERISKEQRSKIMSSIRSNNTQIEILLGKLLWAKGYRYRKNDKSLPGTPDFSLKRFKLALFCDGEFWHGKNWEQKKTRIQQNREFWIAKIERNIARDIRVNQELSDMGWTVLRFWEGDIKRDSESVVKLIIEAIFETNQLNNKIIRSNQ